MQLQTIKAIAIIAYTIIWFCPCHAQENYVVRITASNCSYSDGSGATNTLTGFILKNQGIMTALHGVCGCKTIAVEDAAGRDLGRMEVLSVDIENDIALLTSNRIDVSSGFEFLKVLPTPLGGQNVTMIGYGYGISKPKTSIDANIRKTPIRNLIDCLGPTHKGPLGERNSPNIWNEVLDVEIPIAPGCSGSPIIYGGKVIGVADGGLDRGSTNYCWAIPVSNINLTSKNLVQSTYSKLAQQNPERIFVLTCNLDNDLFSANMVRVAGGNYFMGSNIGAENEIPFHEVSIPDFSIGKYEVTQKEWQLIMGESENPSVHNSCPKCPVENVSWYDVNNFIKKLNDKYPNKGYRLPTEAEWEFAAKEGRKSTYYNYSGSNNKNEVSWNGENSGNESHRVGNKSPNALGIYDMSGNVWEWCEDWYHSSYENAPSDGSAWLYPKNQYKVVRGGSWVKNGDDCRVTYHGWENPNVQNDHIGFRLARSNR